MAHYGSAFYDGSTHYDEADPAPTSPKKRMKVKLGLDHLTHDELADKADTVLKFIRAEKQTAWLIGEVVPGTGHVRI